MSHHVYVVRYDHRYGCDVSAYATEEQAHKARADLCLAWADEVHDPEVQSAIRAAYAAKEWQHCASLYHEYRDDEHIEVHDIEVCGVDAAARVADEKTNVVHHARLLPTKDWPGTSACRRMFWWASSAVTFGADTQNMKVWLPKDQPPLSCLECIAIVGED